MKPVFVVFEGMDGCGKSTVSEMVADRLNAMRLVTPPEEFRDFRGKIDDAYKSSGLAAQLFYASAVVNASALVKESAGRDIVMDRYAASTMAYDKCSRDSGLPDAFWIDNIFATIAVPDIVIYLDAPADIRQKRMESRPQKGATDDDSIRKEQQLAERYKTVLSLLEKQKWTIRRIANETTPEECVNKCLKEITLVKQT